MNEKLNLFQAIPLGIGSIMGSGILFLPSLTYYVSQNDVGLSWILTILICLPGVIFFSDMVKHLADPQEGMAGFVRLGLGNYAGSSIYLLLLGTVIFGMPSAAIIAGDYLSHLTGIDHIGIYCSYFLIIISIIINLKGITTSANFSFLISIILLFVGALLIYISSSYVENYNNVKPVFNSYNTYSGIVLAFWAFAGFENLTFLFGRFKNPKRDLSITIFVSILTCGAIYLGLVLNYSSIISFDQIEKTVGLLQISSITGDNKLNILITVFAVLAVLINLISWTGGVSELIIQTSKKGFLPASIQKNNPKRNAVLLLGAIFIVNLTFATLNRSVFFSLLELVSTNFLLIYVLALFSYSIFIKNYIKKLMSMIMAVGLSITMTSSGLLLIYPIFIILLTAIIIVRKMKYA